MTQRQALEEVKAKTEDIFVPVKLAAKVCGIDDKLIRWEANNKAVNGVAWVFGFRVHVIDSQDDHGKHRRYMVHRESFINAIEGGETNGNNPCLSSH